jgi:predicted lysophospholipase L1 biosynthesis ABC-type transport system permease subunit
VNEKFAKKFFAGRQPLGQLFYDNDEGDSTKTPNRIVGVVGNAKYAGVRDPAEPMYFVPIADGDWPFLVLVVRATTKGSSVRRAMTQAITTVAPGIGQGDPLPLSSSVDEALVRERMSAALATLFGIIALGLAAVGLYGVMLYQVGERTTEIGIRVALGARPVSVMWLVLGQSLTVASVGLAAGLPLAVLTGRAVRAQLYGVAPYDVVALLAAAVLLIAVTVAASLVPARKAIRVDPITALRS